MHAARMPEWGAVQFNASILCVSAGDSSRLVAIESYPARGPLSLTASGAIFSTNGVATAQRNVRAPENLLGFPSRSSPDLRLGAKRIENGAGLQGARWTPVAFTVLS
jgi:hypothetical protein